MCSPVLYKSGKRITITEAAVMSNYCSKCGAELKAMSKFCLKCGKPVAAAPQKSV